MIVVVYVRVFNIWTMPEIIGHTRLIINGLIGKPIINCYSQLLSINNNDGPGNKFLTGVCRRVGLGVFGCMWVYVGEVGECKGTCW